LDGVGELPHLDSLLSISELKGVHGYPVQVRLAWTGRKFTGKSLMPAKKRILLEIGAF
jgi:hypothetical protein